MKRLNINFLKCGLFSLFYLFLVSTEIKAQQTGPNAPDFMGFEPVDGKDMVSLMTGDFTYTIPLMDVGGYPIVLSNISGVGIGQEATWVGLGWRLNVGAMHRGIVNVPDDSEQNVRFNVSSRTGSVTYQTVGLSIGHKGVGLAIQKSWGDVNTMSGTVSFLGVGMSVNDVGDYRMGYQSSFGSFDPQSGEMSVLGVSRKSGRFTGIKSLGISLLSDGVGGLGSILSASTNSYQSISQGSSHVEIFSKGMAVPIFNFIQLSYQHVLEKWTYLEGHQIKKTGILYPDQGLTSTGYSEDVNIGEDLIDFEFDKSSFESPMRSLKQPHMMMPAYDNYRVSGQGISASVKLKLKEVGQLYNFRQIRDPLIKNDYTGSPYETFNIDSRFNKEELANYHTGDYLQYLEGNTGSSNWKINADKVLGVFSSQTEYEDLDGTNITSTDKFINKDFGKSFITYFTNEEIVANGSNNSTGLFTKGFIEADSRIATDRSNTDLFPSKGIGAFSVTDEQGLTYHYSLPIYQREKIVSRYDDEGNSETSNKTASISIDPYAVTWLLTGITAPDYIDVNSNFKIDEGDYGYWVNFDYGRFSDSYLWKERGEKKFRWREKYESFSSELGLKDIYYLNKVQTKTHTALFVKDIREDGLGGAYTTLTQTPNLTTGGGSYRYQWTLGQATPHKLMRLNRIILLKNEDVPSPLDYSVGIHDDYVDPTNGTQIAKLENYAVNLSPGEYPSAPTFSRLLNFYEMDNIFDYKDYAVYQSELESKALKIIKFDHDYSLSKGCLNSNATTKGKLTLNSISEYGRNDVLTSPPYVFSYYNDYDYDDGIDPLAYNPDYLIEEMNSDEWGNFSKTANSFEGDNWSLKSILTPLGSEISVIYEEDSYYNEYALGEEMQFQLTSYVYLPDTDEFDLFFPNRIGDFFSLNDQVDVSARFGILDRRKVGGNWVAEQDDDESFSATITGIATDNRSVRVSIQNGSPAHIVLLHYLDYSDNSNDTTLESNLLDYLDISITKPAYSNIAEIKGGGVRVKEITLNDFSGGVYTTEYNYKNANGRTTGVTSYSPKDFILAPQYIPYQSLLPPPNVIYEQVTTRQLSVNDEFESTTRYTFDIPKFSLNVSNKDYVIPGFLEISTSKDVITNNVNTVSQHDGLLYEYIETTNPGEPWEYFYYETKRERNSNIENNLSVIGRLKSTEYFNSMNELVGKTLKEYYEPNEIDRGLNKETHMNERKVTTTVVETSPSHDAFYYDMYLQTSTSIEEFSSMLKSTTSFTGGVQNSTEYLDYDILLGQPRTVLSENSFGDRQRGEAVYAHEVYSDMGPKTENLNNKNMLKQIASSYLYSDNSNDVYTDDKLLAADIQTWENTWDYRKKITGSGIGDYYVTSSTDEQGVAHYPVWRKDANYVWNGELDASIGAKGTFLGFDETDKFIFTNSGGASSNGQNWVKTGSVTKYNHYSDPLESKDVNNLYAASHFDLNGEMVIAVVGNGALSETGCSGAEYSDGNSLSGEVMKGGSALWRHSSVAGTQVHTGEYSLLVYGGNDGFVKKFLNDDAGYDVGFDDEKAYIISFWVYGAPEDAEINIKTYSVSGSLTYDYTISTNDCQKLQFGNWFLVTKTINPLNTLLGGNNKHYIKYIIRAKSGISSPLYMDDFRIHPVNASISSYVYDDQGRVSYILNANNIGTYYQYNDKGQLEEVHSEIAGDAVTGGFKRTSKAEYHFARD